MRGKRKYTITGIDEHGKEVESEFVIPTSKSFNVFDGEYLNKGDLISDGLVSPHDLLQIKGLDAAAEFILNSIQTVYRIQGVKINDKLLEIIMKVMFSKVEITDLKDRLLPFI